MFKSKTSRKPKMRTSNSRKNVYYKSYRRPRPMNEAKRIVKKVVKWSIIGGSAGAAYGVYVMKKGNR